MRDTQNMECFAIFYYFFRLISYKLILQLALIDPVFEIIFQNTPKRAPVVMRSTRTMSSDQSETLYRTTGIRRAQRQLTVQRFRNRTHFFSTFYIHLTLQKSLSPRAIGSFSSWLPPWYGYERIIVFAYTHR